ncbi:MULTISPECIES: collagen-like protein [Flavobacteriaceae]|uniref:collagen-like protein n=1 Tax=Flavobacteriaceae TaxID=49546 RepID=UPI001492E95F|nr:MULTISPECIES: collagen-like protein [Allomuricauda]MDC6366410.1 collagen-like protein [Muricauda sp. AC10]
MQKKSRFIYALAVLFIGSLITSCSGEDGETGPVGPQGPQGEQGPDGADGADGTDGTDGEQGEQGEPGTANVMYSDWVATEFGNSIVATSTSFTIDAPDVDEDMLDFGTILVYGRRIDITLGNIVYPLPIVFGAARQQSYYFRAQDGEIRITVSANEEGESVVDGSFLEEYRYVLIPGGTPVDTDSPGGLTGKSMDYSKMTYEEVAKHFGFEE